VGENRWSGGVEDRKRNEKEAKAGDDVPRGKKGDQSSRLEGSKEPAEDREKQEVLKKFKDRES
jgi:hypothetical protein